MKTKQIFKLMNVVSWIVFIGYCIKAGAIAIVSILSLFGNKNATENLYMGIDLSDMYDFNTTYFICVVILLVLMASFKAYMFYLLIKIFKQVDYNMPFKDEVLKLIFKISYVSLSVGILGAIGKVYLTWLATKVMFAQIDIGASAYVFMAGVIFIVASLFKRAIAIQSENELTI
ncbi:DUF2975 domain-containing protein [Psychroserpens algicola]|uniref:DUF2975 domain-containing protein n=1 Tax=Psychroserpens algicola TaxID=1719034 RepID=A0ABT0H458_9FLAO|nr:DUF2975 domain-containing protein [Psychroserpens algicola]MCK8479165.1 DUF2975 domain-containing protein [Psychroserpens algicola]